MIRAANDPSRAVGRELATAEIVTDLADLELQQAAAGGAPNLGRILELLARVRAARRALELRHGRPLARPSFARVNARPS